MGYFQLHPDSDYLIKSESPSPDPPSLEYLGEPDPMTALTTRPRQLPLALPTTPLASGQLGAAADQAAAAHIFERYRARLAEETRRRHDADLGCFTAYLTVLSTAPAGDLATTPIAWQGVTWGLVEGFMQWQLQQGYAIGSINVRLSTVKVYAKLASSTGAISVDTYAQIKTVAGFRQAEGRRVDRQRETTRKGAKKAEASAISPEQAARLKQISDPRDRLLMCLLLDHGLRVGEVTILEFKHFDLKRGVLRFFRPKVDKQQQHKLSPATLAAAEDYLYDLSADQHIHMFGGTRAVRARVSKYGQAIGLASLSPHDCRHYWATAAANAGTPLKVLQDAGGWSSPKMPLHYMESAEIANEGVKLE